MQMTTNIFLHLSPQITCATVPPQRAVARRWEVTALQQPVQSELPGQVDAADHQGPGSWQEHWTWLHPHHQRTPAGQGHRHRYTVHGYMSGVVASSYVCLCVCVGHDVDECALFSCFPSKRPPALCNSAQPAARPIYTSHLPLSLSHACLSF